MAIKKSVLRKETEHSRIYDGMRGIFSDSASLKKKSHFQLLENMYVDYRGDADAVESVPGFRKLISLKEQINGLFIQKISDNEKYLIIHAGINVYRFKTEEIESAQLAFSIGSLKNVKSSAFFFGKEIYLMDGEKILRIDQNGNSATVGMTEAEPYIPTLYKNKHKYEDRNLLSEKAKECFSVNDTSEYIFGSPGLKYVVTDEKKHLCSVVGGTGISGELHIPSYAMIDGESYRVAEIGDRAFSNNENITALYTNPNLCTVGTAAFSGCTALKTVVICYSVTELLEESFSGCCSLEELTLSYFPMAFGNNSFYACDSLSKVKCVNSYYDFVRITEGSGLETKTPVLALPHTEISLGLALKGPVRETTGVFIDGALKTGTYDRTNRIIKLDFENEYEIKGKEITVIYLLEANDLGYDEESFLSTEGGRACGGAEAIYGCKLCESFDGRTFLSGNPLFPGVVFYSEKDKSSNTQPLYFGVRNFFTDGVAVDSVTDLLSTNGKLAVFKSGDDGSGTIFYHEPRSTEQRVLYPVSYVHGSIPVYGGAVNFFDEPVFITDRGLCALEKANGSDYREVKCRSSGISSLLCREPLKEALLTEWMGYLVLALGDKFYLADSRDTYSHEGVLQYEWYRLTDIGTYQNDSRIYRYASDPEEGYELSDDPDGKVSGVVISKNTERKRIFYVEENGKKLLVYPTEEAEGGVFSPAAAVLGDGELLYFGTECGDVCMFNTDKRGVPPEKLLSSADFSMSEYQSVMGGRIHPSFYSFASHRVNYGILTGFDDCDTPHLTKSTVRDSLVIKFKTFEGSFVSVFAETEGGRMHRLAGIPLSRLSFDEVCFSELTVLPMEFTSVKVPEFERNWIEKRFYICSDAFCSPFGVYSLSYRYKIKGKIKN